VVLTGGGIRPGRDAGRREKLLRLDAAAALVPDGAFITMGGVLLNRPPAAFVRELARQRRRRLRFVKPSPAYDLDLLAAAGCVDEAAIGITTFESRFGQSRQFRRAVERGALKVREHS
jgi:glutaconate CoA-transferase subunit A